MQWWWGGRTSRALKRSTMAMLTRIVPTMNSAIASTGAIHALMVALLFHCVHCSSSSLGSSAPHHTRDEPPRCIAYYTPELCTTWIALSDGNTTSLCVFALLKLSHPLLNHTPCILRTQDLEAEMLQQSEKRRGSEHGVVA